MYNIDLDIIKTFGPRTENRYVVEGVGQVRSGRDFFFNDA
jgi:hypothetical protein